MCYDNENNDREIIFLTYEEIIEIHQEQIEEFGGLEGLRDEHSLKSAIAQPSMGAFGQYLHNDLYEMGAAYLFHISNNQPFIDGNKRTGYNAAELFLELNGNEG